MVSGLLSKWNSRRTFLLSKFLTFLSTMTRTCCNGVIGESMDPDLLMTACCGSFVAGTWTLLLLLVALATFLSAEGIVVFVLWCDLIPKTGVSLFPVATMKKFDSEPKLLSNDDYDNWKWLKCDHKEGKKSEWIRLGKGESSKWKERRKKSVVNANL